MQYKPVTVQFNTAFKGTSVLQVHSRYFTDNSLVHSPSWSNRSSVQQCIKSDIFLPRSPAVAPGWWSTSAAALAPAPCFAPEDFSRARLQAAGLQEGRSERTTSDQRSQFSLTERHMGDYDYYKQLCEVLLSLLAGVQQPTFKNVCHRVNTPL